MAVGDVHVFPGFFTPLLTQLSFQSHRLLFSHASEVRAENTPERKLASTGYRTYNHQAMNLTRSPVTTEPPKLGLFLTKQSLVLMTMKRRPLKTFEAKEEMSGEKQSLNFPRCFLQYQRQISSCNPFPNKP